MLTRIRRFLAAPVFEDEFENRVAGLFNVVLLVILAATVLGTVVVIPLEPSEVVSNLIFGVLISAAILGLRRLLFRGHIKIISTLLSALLWAVITYLVFSGEGARDPILTGYFLVIALSGVLLGGWGAIAFGLLCWASVLGILGVQVQGLYSFDQGPVGLMDAITLTLTIGLTVLLLDFAVRSINAGLARAHRNEQAQHQANRELEAIRASLEQRVAERTCDLERRTAHLEASTQVGNAVTSILNTEQLIQRVVDLIRERFELYHVALFMLDDSGEWAEFRAGTGEIGRLLLGEKPRLQVGGKSMIGWCAANAQARAIQDTRAESEQLDHPHPTETRSEAALPLIVRGRVIGALSAQSIQVGTFDQDTMAALQIIADQVAVALDNARLFAESQAALEAERRAYGEISRQGWLQTIQTQADRRYVCDSQGARAIVSQPVQDGSAQAADHPLQPELIQAVRTGQTIQPDKATITIPIKIRDNVLGAVRLCKAEPANEWTAGEVALTQILTEQLSVALESARLYQDTHRRAAQEKLIGDIAARVRETLDMETILKTAISEMRNALNLAEVEVDVNPALAAGADKDDHVEQPIQGQTNP